MVRRDAAMGATMGHRCRPAAGPHPRPARAVPPCSPPALAWMLNDLPSASLYAARACARNEPSRSASCRGPAGRGGRAGCRLLPPSSPVRGPPSCGRSHPTWQACLPHSPRSLPVHSTRVPTWSLAVSRSSRGSSSRSAASQGGSCLAATQPSAEEMRGGGGSGRQRIEFSPEGGRQAVQSEPCSSWRARQAPCEQRRPP